MITKVRGLTNELTTATYSDAALTTIIELYPLMDELGTEPYYWDYTTEPPTKVSNAAWLATYDLNAAARDVWEEKAAILSQDYDFKADGGDYTRSQAYEQAQKQARFFASKRSPSNIRLRPYPRPLPRLVDQDLP
jgi:hypothetical protein